jgi:hypothetical protein
VPDRSGCLFFLFFLLGALQVFIYLPVFDASIFLFFFFFSPPLFGPLGASGLYLPAADASFSIHTYTLTYADVW